MRSPNKIPVIQLKRNILYSGVMNLSLGLETSRLGIVWFFVSLLLE